LRSQKDQQIIPFHLESLKGEDLILKDFTQAIASSSHWKRVAGEENLKGNWKLVSGKPPTIGPKNQPIGISLELSFHERRYDLRVFQDQPSPAAPPFKQIPGEGGSFDLTRSAGQTTILHLNRQTPGGSPVSLSGSYTLGFLDEKTLRLISQDGNVLEWKRLDGPIEDSAAAPRKP
jgi:hypothetical protein